MLKFSDIVLYKIYHATPEHSGATPVVDKVISF